MADNNSPALQVAAEPKSGLPKFLDEVDLTAMEFGFLAAFWVGICILVSVVDPAVITGAPPPSPPSQREHQTAMQSLTPVCSTPTCSCPLPLLPAAHLAASVMPSHPMHEKSELTATTLR